MGVLEGELLPMIDTRYRTDPKARMLVSTVHVFDGETHSSVFPAALSRSLRTIYDFAGEDAAKPLSARASFASRTSAPSKT